MFCLFYLAFLFICSQEKREEECENERDCNHFFIANNIILWKATNWRPIHHNITFCSLSLSEHWKMTLSLSLSLSLSLYGWVRVRVFWFLLLHVSGQYIWRPDMEFAFCRWGALFFLAFFWTFAFHNLWLHRGSCMEGYPPSKDLKN